MEKYGMMKNTKVVPIETTFKDFFRIWLKVTKPFHKLSPSQIELVGSILYFYYKYKSSIKDDNLLWKIVFDYDTRLLIREEIGMNVALFNNMLTSLRKLDVIIGNKINPIYIPIISTDSKEFNLIYRFIIKNGEEEK